MDKRSRRRKAPKPKRQMPIEEELDHVIPYEVIEEDGSYTNKIKCSYCCKMFEAVEGHEQHRCRKVKDFLLSCLSCNKRYVDHFFNEETERIYPETENQIENHAEAASQRAVVAKSSYECCVCQKTYSDISITIRHIKYHAQRKASVAEPTLHCGHCRKSFTTKQQLNKHETVHTDARPFKCNDCDKWFKTLDNVKRHMSVHNDERPFVCSTCAKEFKAKHTLKKHEQTHDDKRGFQCPECGKKYKAKNSLRDHLRVHTGQRPYKCQQCDQAFYRPSHLATHKLVHSKLKPFSCKDCDKSFGRREHLKVHERIHSGEKPFKCNLCDRAFNQQAGLQAHIVSHSENRPHTCEKCKKTFKYQSQVKHHACKPDEIELRVNEGQRRTSEIGGDKVPPSSSSEISSPTPCLNPTSTIILIQIQSPPQTAMLSEGIEDPHRVIAPGDGNRDEDSDNMLQGSSASSNDVVVPEQITVENSATVSGEEAREMIAGLEDMIAIAEISADLKNSCVTPEVV